MQSIFRILLRMSMTGAALLLLAATPVRAQSLGDLVEQLGIQQLARDYLRPGVDAVGYTLNSGYAHTARVDTGFSVWAGAKVVTTFIPDADRTFVAMLPPDLTGLGYPSRMVTATVVGDEGAVLRSSDPSQPEIQLPGGTGLQQALLVMPQLSIGSVLGTEVILRGIPPVTYDPEVGKVSFYGAGLKHELTHYFDTPFALAVVAGMQQFEITDVIDGQGYAGMLLASVDARMLTLFGGVGYEAYRIDVSYDPVPQAGVDPGPVTLEFQRRNLRFSFGGALTLLSLIDLTAEYSFGVQDNLTVGIGLTL